MRRDMAGTGTPCRYCDTPAVDCQHIFIDSGERQWCCAICKYELIERFNQDPSALRTWCEGFE